MWGSWGIPSRWGGWLARINGRYHARWIRRSLLRPALGSAVLGSAALGSAPFALAQRALDLPLAVLLGQHLALVVELAAAPGSQLDLGLAAHQVDLDRHQGVAALLDPGDQLGDLLLVQKQLA